MIIKTILILITNYIDNPYFQYIYSNIQYYVLKFESKRKDNMADSDNGKNHLYRSKKPNSNEQLPYHIQTIVK